MSDANDVRIYEVVSNRKGTAFSMEPFCPGKSGGEDIVSLHQ